MKKYILTDETREYNGVILHRIKAIKNFGDVSEGDLGGWVENEINLLQKGDCWVYNNAIVCENAIVCGSELVYGNYR